METPRPQKRPLLLLCGLIALAILSGCKKSPPTLSLLVWEGYADPSFIQGFEAQCQCKVSAAYMGSSNELVAKLRGGASSNYDVISPSSDVATMLSRSGLVAPLDVAKIPNYAQLSPALTSRELVKQNGQVYGVPFTWGPNPLLYDKTAFSKKPATWAELWDPKFANKLSFWDDLSTILWRRRYSALASPIRPPSTSSAIRNWSK
jgi:spermidine/putrescine-binding protein